MENFIKGANILSDGCGNVKLADFGASIHLENLPLLSVTGSSYIEKSAKGYFCVYFRCFNFLISHILGVCIGWLQKF